MGSLGFGHHRLKSVPGLLGFSQPLGQLVVFSLERGKPPPGRTQPTGGLLQGPTVALEAPLQRPPLPASHRDRLFGVP